MNRLPVPLLGVVVLGGLCLASTPAAIAISAAAAPFGFVQAPGGPFMTDHFGRRLQFHGVNIVPKCPSFSQVASAPGSPCIPDAVNHANTPSYWLNSDPAYLQVDAERTFTDADAVRLADLGFNVARVGIIWRALEPGKMATPQANDADFCTPQALATKPLKAAADQLDTAVVNAYLAHVDATISLLAAHGIYSVIDMHQDDFSEHFNNPTSATPWEGEGAPLWATCTNLTGTTTLAPEGSSMSAGWAEDNLHDVALAMAADHFWSNDVSGNLQGQFIRVWQEVAKHYRDNQWILGYDPFNEPYDQALTAVPGAFDSRLQCFYAGSADPNGRCGAVGTTAVTSGFIPSVLNSSVDPNHLIFYEGPVVTDYHGIQTIGVGVPLNYDHLVFNFHIYPPVGAFGGGQCTSPLCSPNDDVALRHALLIRDNTTTKQPGGPALFAGEFGAEDFVPDISHDTDLFDGSALTSLPVSWAYWSAFQNHDPTGQSQERLFTTDRQLTPKGAVLARAYPRATAGTPTAGSQSVSSDSVFTYAYAPDHSISAPTEIVLPAMHYGAGYSVTASSATVTSPCGASILTLVADPTATAVTVKVQPASGCRQPTYVHNAASGCSPHNPCSTPGTSGGEPPGAAPALLLLAALLALTCGGLLPRRAKLSRITRRRTA